MCPSFFQILSPGIGPLQCIIISEIFPLWARSTAYGITRIVAMTFSLATIVSFLSFVEAIHDYGQSIKYSLSIFISLSIVESDRLIISCSEGNQSYDKIAFSTLFLALSSKLSNIDAGQFQERMTFGWTKCWKWPWYQSWREILMTIYSFNPPIGRPIFTL